MNTSGKVRFCLSDTRSGCLQKDKSHSLLNCGLKTIPIGKQVLFRTLNVTVRLQEQLRRNYGRTRSAYTYIEQIENLVYASVIPFYFFTSSDVLLPSAIHFLGEYSLGDVSTNAINLKGEGHPT